VGFESYWAAAMERRARKAIRKINFDFIDKNNYMVIDS
jgi:hypothetical protein